MPIKWRKDMNFRVRSEFQIADLSDDEDNQYRTAQRANFKMGETVQSYGGDVEEKTKTKRYRGGRNGRTM